MKIISTDRTLKSSYLLRNKSIHSFEALMQFVKALPYGRNSNRENFGLVIQEAKGTCSSKHAYLKSVAEENKFSDVKLILGIFKMSGSNIPEIKSVLAQYSLPYIPEAHCYLKVNDKRIDCTNLSFDINDHLEDILIEKEISPSDVNDFKIQFHQDFIQSHITKMNWDITLEKLWEIREQCIQVLSQ